MTFGAAQVSSEETEVVQGEDLQTDRQHQIQMLLEYQHITTNILFACVSSTNPLVELLLLLSEDTGDLLWELNEVAHFYQLLTDPTDTGR